MTRNVYGPPRSLIMLGDDGCISCLGTVEIEGSVTETSLLLCPGDDELWHGTTYDQLHTFLVAHDGHALANVQDGHIEVIDEEDEELTAEEMLRLLGDQDGSQT